MAHDLSDDSRILRFWNAFATATRASGKRFVIMQFGDSKSLADELAASVIAGTKRGTASLRRDFTSLGLPLPKLGDLGIVVDGNREPCCIVRIAEVNVKPMRDVDERFAANEGGGDGSLSWWMSSHERYFRRQVARESFPVNADTEVVLERFEVVWPPEHVHFRPRRT